MSSISGTRTVVINGHSVTIHDGETVADLLEKIPDADDEFDRSIETTAVVRDADVTLEDGEVSYPDEDAIVSFDLLTVEDADILYCYRLKASDRPAYDVREYEVMITADVEHTPRVDADSPDDAEDAARAYVAEEYGVDPLTVRHETELPDGRHQVCVWATRTFERRETAATEENAVKRATGFVTLEYDVQTSDIRSTDVRTLREVAA